MSIFTPSKTQKKSVDFINTTVDKKVLSNLLSKIYDDFGTAKSATLSNSLKNLGFKYATLAGVTISIEDLEVPPEKKDLLASAEGELEKSNQRFLRGEITEVERYTKVIDTWNETTERLTKMVVENFDRLNPIYMMAFSGARGNLSQVRQLVGMRGLMADSQGQIIDQPIKTNFREGLSVTDYIISSYGARKGIVDTALKTADSGYLTRRLVDVAQDVIISEADCSTTNGVMMRGIIEGENEIVSLKARIVSRTAAIDVVSEDGEVLASAGEVISPAIAQKIAEGGVKEVLLRSALTCESQFGVCQKCYGWSLTTNKIVDMGEAIGIMAAQSIGEPGTQLTMRTFHTGGVVNSAINRERIVAKSAGKLLSDIPTRENRTRHGDVVNVTTRDFALEVESKKGTVTYNIPFNSTVFVKDKGETLEDGQIIAEFEPSTSRGDARRLTEKATKDLTSELSGEIFYEGFDADEKRDRQGNISRTANRGGTIWVLGGDVYNLPPSSKLHVDHDQMIMEGDVLAETLIASEYGGEVRIPEDLETQDTDVNGETINAIVNGKELTIVIASLEAANAKLVQTKKELIWQVVDGDGDDDEQERYIIKSPHGTTVEDGSIIAELVDESMLLPTSGEIRFQDVEVDEQRILTSPGKIFFIPEEIHQVSKDISLKSPGIENGQFVKAGTEVVAGVVTRIDGIIEIVEDNDIIHEVVIRPGQVHRVDDVNTLKVEDGEVVDAGVEIAPGIKTEERSMITISYEMDDAEDFDEDEPEDSSSYEYANVLIRPVQEFDVSPRQVDVAFSSTEDEHITIVPVTQLHFNDGDKVRQVEGAPLVRTSLVLQMKGYLSRLKGVTELYDVDDETKGLKIVVLENLTIRRDTSSTDIRNEATVTQLLVGHGDIIEKKTPVVKTQVLAQTGGRISLGHAGEKKDIRRLLLITPDHSVVLKAPDEPLVKANDFIRSDQPLTRSKFTSPISGQVVSVDKNNITVRKGRPYLISVGTQLQLENRTIAQQGDLVATLIFERQKTGDIVQGLPRVEELLEARKPKESAILAPYNATVELIWEDDSPRVFLVSETHGREEFNIPLGSNILVEDKNTVEAGQPLTDGPINPHDLLIVKGMKAVRQLLVDEVQRVYRSQGVEIADKHIEVIVRQMTKKVQVTEGGNTLLLQGELVDEKSLIEANTKLKASGDEDQRYAEGDPVLLGITKASLNTDSFISAASFQETTRVLTEAAVEGKRDILRGLKENVIIGRLIPAGTGFPHFKDEREDNLDEAAAAARSASRKPSAILEEIESMFGSPDITPESMSGILLDDGSDVQELMSDQEDSYDEEDFEESSPMILEDEEA